MEIVEVFLLFVIAVEGVLMLRKKPTYKIEEPSMANRRDVHGVYRNPLGDSYRKSSRNLYVPIKPGSKMIDSLEDDEE